MFSSVLVFFFVFKDTATTEIYTYGHTLSLHDALPIYLDLPGTRLRLRRFRQGHRQDALLEFRLGVVRGDAGGQRNGAVEGAVADLLPVAGDRKSTRLNSSH